VDQAGAPQPHEHQQQADQRAGTEHAVDAVDRAEVVDEPHGGVPVVQPRQGRQCRAEVTEAADRADDGENGADGGGPCPTVLYSNRDCCAGHRDTYPGEVFEQDHAGEACDVRLDQVELTARVARVRMERRNGERAREGRGDGGRGDHWTGHGGGLGHLTCPLP